MVLKGYFYVGVFLSSLCESNIFGVRAVVGMDACNVFSQGVLTIIPLIRSLISVVVTRACTGYCAGPPLCSMVVTALSGAGSASQLFE